MNELQMNKLIIININGENEVESGVSFVNNLVVSEFNKVGEPGGSRYDSSVDLSDEFSFFVLGFGFVPFHETGFALAV